jgi:perosamine synthetase
MIPVHRPCLGQEELDAVARVFASRWLGMGAVSAEFEDRLREFLGARHVIAVSSGTAALHLALEALALPAAAEVILPSLTFVSTVQAVLAAGLRPVFCEVLPQTLNLDMDDVRRRLSERTRAVVAVHYGGFPCAMEELLRLAGEHRLRVVEDAAHAFGSRVRGRSAGTLGDVGCFSFDPIKNITCGGGGAIATDDDDLARRLGPRHNVGISQASWQRLDSERPWFYEVTGRGLRYHLGDMNAAIGLEQLRKAGTFQAAKRAIVRCYDQAFQDMAGVACLAHDLDDAFPFSYVIRVLEGRRDRLMQALRRRGIGSTVEFIPNHLQPAFTEFRVSLPVSERLYAEIVSLPLHAEMGDSDVEQVIAAVREFFEEDAHGRSAR